MGGPFGSLSERGKTGGGKKNGRWRAEENREAGEAVLKGVR